jgi:hypothetical protein
MTAPRTIAAVDALRAVMPMPSGTVADESCAIPAKYVAARLYAWPDVGLPQKLEEDRGRWPEADLRVRLAYTVAAKGEARVLTRDRDVSLALAAWVDEAHAAVDTHRRNPMWWDAYIEAVRFDVVRSVDVRAVGIVVVLRLNPDYVPTESGS